MPSIFKPQQQFQTPRQRGAAFHQLYGTSLQRWMDATGQPRPHGAVRWFDLMPGHFLKLRDDAESTNPLPPLHHGSRARLVMPTEGLGTSNPAVVEVLPAFGAPRVGAAPSVDAVLRNPYWLGVTISYPRQGLCRDEKHVFYPTPLRGDDVEATLKLWRLDGLRWEYFGSRPIFCPRWSVEAACVSRQPFTYFAVSENEKYLTVGTAYAVPSGAKKVIYLNGDTVEQLALVRIGGCRVPVERVEEKLVGAGATQVPWEEARLRRNNGVLFRATPKVLRQVAKFCTRHFHKHVVEGQRDLMVGYRG